MFEWIKTNRLILGVGSLLVLLIVVTSVLAPQSSSGYKRQASSRIQTPIVDQATSDNPAESLNALTQALHQVIHSNQQLEAHNAILDKKNASLLHHMREAIQQTEP